LPVGLPDGISFSLELHPVAGIIHAIGNQQLTTQNQRSSNEF
jgi:hypothetical protein